MGFTQESGNPGEGVVYLVDKKTKLDCGPRGLGFHTPALHTVSAFPCVFKLDYICHSIGVNNLCNRTLLSTKEFAVVGS